MIKILFISLFFNSGNVKPIAELEIVKRPQGDERIEITSKFGFTSSSCGFLFMKKYDKCKIDGCNERGRKTKYGIYFPKGYCAVHYYRLLKYGNPKLHGTSNSPIKCKVSGCVNGGRIKPSGTVVFPCGYCLNHYNSFKRYGDPLFAKRDKILSKEAKLVRYIHNGIIQRCNNKNYPKYHNYGGRGIKVSKRWLGEQGIENFAKDMGERPSLKHSVDRIDNNKGYYPKNCRWATRHQQTSNMRTNNSVVGVSFRKCIDKWTAKLTVNKKIISLGDFKIYEDAVVARKQAEIKYLGYNL